MNRKLTSFAPGTTKVIRFELSISGTPQDITGDTVTFRMKNSIDDADVAAVVSSVADVATEGASGIAIVTLIPDDTKALPDGKYHWDVEWVTSGGQEYVPASGEVRLDERVSDPPA